MGWPINPDGLKAVLLNIRERYGNPKMFVTENGCALEDAPDADGFVEDWARVDYQTGRRIPKQSARWYNAVITNNAVSD